MLLRCEAVRRELESLGIEAFLHRSIRSSLMTYGKVLRQDGSDQEELHVRAKSIDVMCRAWLELFKDL